MSGEVNASGNAPAAEGKTSTSRFVRWSDQETDLIIRSIIEFCNRHDTALRSIKGEPGKTSALRDSLINELAAKLNRSKRAVYIKVIGVFENIDSGMEGLRDMENMLSTILGHVSRRKLSLSGFNKLKRPFKSPCEEEDEWTKNEEEQLIMGVCTVTNMPLGTLFKDVEAKMIPWSLIQTYVRTKSPLACYTHFKKKLKLTYWNGKFPKPWDRAADLSLINNISEQKPSDINSISWIKVQQQLSDEYNGSIEFIKTRFRTLFKAESTTSTPSLIDKLNMLSADITKDISFLENTPESSPPSGSNMFYGDEEQKELHQKLKTMCTACMQNTNPNAENRRRNLQDTLDEDSAEFKTSNIPDTNISSMQYTEESSVDASSNTSENYTETINNHPNSDDSLSPSLQVSPQIYENEH